MEEITKHDLEIHKNLGWKDKVLLLNKKEQKTVNKIENKILENQRIVTRLNEEYHRLNMIKAEYCLQNAGMSQLLLMKYCITGSTQ